MSEEQVVRNCAPTLAGLKTGSMFSCEFASRAELNESIRALNRSLTPKGLRVLPLRCAHGRALIYVYRPGRLEKDLSGDAASALLREFGYPCGNSGKCIAKLMARLKADGEFPHEVGLFLGYPTEDVAGFIANHARGCKCVGCWKVYGDEAKAREKFARYKRCTSAYYEQWRRGIPIERLATKDPL